MTPIERMIDKACGYTPEIEAAHKAKKQAEKRQQQAFENLLEAVENWYRHDKGFTRIALRSAWEKVVAENTKGK